MTNNTKQNRWTPAQEQFVRDNADKLTFEQMAEQLGRTTRAVQLFILRKRIPCGDRKIKRNILYETLRKQVIRPELFVPDRQFYEEVGINQMRWSDLYFGRSQIKDMEYLSLIEFFGISLKEAFEARQLTIEFDFDENEEPEKKEKKKRE